MLSARSIRKVGFVLVTLVLQALVVVLLATAPAFAAAPGPTPPAPLRTGIGNWQVINGRPQEYDFQYAGLGLPVQILLGMDPASSVGFSVYTDGQWRDLANGDRSVMPIGRGTHNAHAVGDLFWQLVSPANGLYHVQIYTLSAGTARFWIAQAGPGSSGLTPISPAVVTATPVPTVKPVVLTPKPVVVAGTAPTATVPVAPRIAATTTVTLTAGTPSTVTLTATPKAAVVTTATLTAPTAPTTVLALPAKATAPKATPAPLRTGIGNWQVINGRPQEYDFQYAGLGLPVQILLGMDPASSVGFSVYTDGQWRDLANGDRSVMPIGRGTHNAHAVGDLFWQLVSPANGLYHVQIYTLSAGTARFWIAQAGPGSSALTPISPAVTAK